MHTIQIYRASRAHAYLLVFKAFKEVADKAGEELSQQTLAGSMCYALDLMLSLLGLYWLQNDMGDFVEDGEPWGRSFFLSLFRAVCDAPRVIFDKGVIPAVSVNSTKREGNLAQENQDTQLTWYTKPLQPVL